jgi:capsular exopolysaccharide synthesis family protein
MSDFSDKKPTQPNGKRHSNGRYDGELYRGEMYRGESPFADGKAEDEIDLKRLFAGTLRYKWWVIGITLISFLGAYLYAEMQQPVYQSSGTILIAQEQNRYTWAGTDLSSMMQSSFGVGTGSRLTNEIQVLQSRTLAEEIAMVLMDRINMENGERFPIVQFEYPEDTTLVSLGTVALRIQNRMNLEQVDQDTDVLRITYSSPSPQEAKELVDITMDTYSDVSARQKRMAANSALDFLEEEREDVEQRLADAEVALQNYMENTNLVQVDGQTQAVIQRMADLESQRQQLQVQQVAVSSSIESYEDQLDQIRPGLAEQFAENISGRLERAQFRLAELRTEESLLLQNNPALRNNPEQEPQFVQLQQEIETVRNEIRDITSNLLEADDSDVFIGFLEEQDGGVTTRIIELRRNLIELKIEQSQLNAQEQVLEQRMEEENQFFDGLPANMLELARLRREVQIQEQLFNTISSQYAETQLWEQTQYGAGRPIDYGYLPDPNYPSSPNKMLYSLIGLMMGGVLSVGFVVGKEAFNTTVDGTEKMRETGFPLLAVIPDFSDVIRNRYNGESFIEVKGKKVATSWSALLDTVSPISESYRRLQNNILFGDPDVDHNVILVTSSRKGEGKTTVSINLAVTLAEAGKKVLLVDTDLRRPNVHRVTGESRAPGIAEIFYDKCSLNEAIRPTIAPGVHLISVGENIPNPAAVMQSRKLRELIDRVKKEFDHVIVDTPPYGVITDAAPVMQKADGIILVARFGDTQVNELNHTVENLNRIRANVLGTALTAYRHKQSADYYYYNEYTYDSYQAYEAYQEQG